MNTQQINDALLPTKEAYNGAACANCIAPSPDLVTCSACKLAKYCSKACQKSNWKKHKTVCKILQSFRLISSSIPGDFVLGRLGLIQKFRCFKNLCKDSSTRDLLQMIQVPENVPDDAWRMAEFFVITPRCCSICQKTDYDEDENENESNTDNDSGSQTGSHHPAGMVTHWQNCKVCKFGWCCSEEHFSQYQPQHTTDMCASYQNSCAVDRFLHNHMKDYGENFLAMPEGVLSTPMTHFPKNWTEYFETRLAEMYGMKDQLPDEFFLAATHQLSQVTNCLYGMYEHDKDIFTKLENLTIHVVGSSQNYELQGGGPTCVWEELLHCLPSVKTLNIVFIGPEACSMFASKLDKYDAIGIECCPDCIGKDRKRTVAFYGKTYHDHFYDKESFTKPDFVVAFNTGMFEEYTESWKKSLGVMLDLDIPCLFTSYNQMEANADYNVLCELNAHTLTGAPVTNPFAVNHPFIDFSENDKFYKNNMHCICFRGRK